MNRILIDRPPSYSWRLSVTNGARCAQVFVIIVPTGLARRYLVQIKFFGSIDIADCSDGLPLLAQGRRLH